jgi:hypothetical protein
MSPGERTVVAITAALLGRGRAIDLLSSTLTVIAASFVLLHLFRPDTGPATTFVATGIAIAIVLLGLAAKYLAVRVAFDAALLQRCAAECMPVAEFDAAMRAMNLLPASKTGRGWIERCRGARRLLMIQTFLLVSQVLALALAVFAAG